MTSSKKPAGERAARLWLLAIDGSAVANEAARYVARWAMALGVDEVRVLTAQPIRSFRAYALNRDEVLADATATAAQLAADALAILEIGGVRHRFVAKVGDPADLIVDAARALDGAEIVLGTHGLGQLSGMLLGSVAYKVVHVAPGPVTLVPARSADEARVGEARVHRMLLAIDGSGASERAAAYVKSLAQSKADLEVEVMHVEAAAGPSEQGPDGDRPDGRALVEPVARDLESAGVQCTTHVTGGPLAQTIVDRAVERNCARIVMGKRGVGGLESLMVGSLAYAVAHLSPLPVTLVR
jgi:nucleotide-binding universal stress UspA family protein